MLTAQKKLLETYPHCSIKIFDTHTLFNNVYNNPGAYGFDPKKKTQNYCASPDFQDRADNPGADQYMFWNDVHPSDRMHHLLAQDLNEQLQTNYNFLSPQTINLTTPDSILAITEESLLKSFQIKYEAKLNKDRSSGCFGFFSHSRIDYKNASLEQILRHALYEDGDRTRDVIRELQWINDKGQIILTVEALEKAMKQLIKDITAENTVKYNC